MPTDHRVCFWGATLLQTAPGVSLAQVVAATEATLICVATGAEEPIRKLELLTYVNVYRRIIADCFSFLGLIAHQA